MSALEVQCPGQTTRAEASQVVREQKGLFDIACNSSDLLCLFYPSMPADWRAAVFFVVVSRPIPSRPPPHTTSWNLLLLYLVLIRIWGQTKKKKKNHNIHSVSNQITESNFTKLYKKGILLQEKQKRPKPNKYWKLIFYWFLFICFIYFFFL